MRNTPPELLVGTPGRYAREVFHNRHPTLVERVAAAHPYTDAQRSTLRALLDESLTGEVRGLPGDAPDWADWDAWDRGYFGRPWADAPFLWAESYFYRRILDAVDYFRPGPWQGVDPFAPMKDAELTDPGLDRDFAWVADLPAEPTAAGFATVVRAAVFGNRADISFRMQEPAVHGDPAAPDELLTDDTDRLRAALREPGPVAVVADNGGREIMADLVLANWLLDTGSADRVTLHVKPMPYYVSDATASDVDAACVRLGRPLDPRIAVRTHWFWCAPLDFGSMPPDLGDDLRGAPRGRRQGRPQLPAAGRRPRLGPDDALRGRRDRPRRSGRRPTHLQVGGGGRARRRHRRAARRRRAALAGQWSARAGAGALTRVARSTRNSSPVGDRLRTWPRGLSRSSAA